MNARVKRLQRVGASIGARPVPRRVLDAAFAQFCKTGELPDRERIASAVVERALESWKRHAPPVVLETGVRDLERLLDQIEAGELPPADPRELSEDLLRAAVCGSEVAQKSARAALRMLVDAGLDLTDPSLLDDAAVPVGAKQFVEVCLAHQHGLRDTALRVGPPIPEAKALFDHMRLYVRIAKELGLGTVEEPAPAA